MGGNSKLNEVNVKTMRDILVVEDHPLVAEATQALLSTLSVGRVVICESEEEALARLSERNDWFRIFLDVSVPGADGLSLVHHVHRQGFSPRSAVVTASENKHWRAEVEAMGFLGYVVKTANVDDFSFALQEVLEGRFNFAENPSEHQAFQLTRKQVEILSLLSTGTPATDISRVLKMPCAVVNNHIQAIFHALRSPNIEQAIATGIRMGHLPLLNPP